MTLRTALTAMALLLSCAHVGAQTPDALQAVARKAIETNPEVSARLNGYRASVDEVDIARAGYYPRVDLSANAGRERDRVSSRDPESDSLSRTGATLSVTQMLWDGLGTRNEVRRLGHAKLTRYFEFVDTTEQVALEAVRAYYDVLRYRRLVELAEDNYVQHKASHDQILSRFRAGVSRGVDLEQAAARLALAESNLATEIANLHDVSARYHRIVGELPPARVEAPTALKQGLPTSTEQALQSAVASSGAVAAAVENLRSVRAQADTRRSAFQPRVELRARSGMGRNYESVPDQRRDAAAEIVLSWNLFNGGADQASVRQIADLVNQAADQRDGVCRDVRQTAVIAYNDTIKLVDQLRFLDANQLAIEKARDAYRKQFDIGQRSLLDLLNAENELYTARRSYVNAEVDLDIAYARVHAATGQLLVALGLSRPGNGLDEVQGWSSGEDAAARCPAAGPEVYVTPRAELDARARRLSNQQPDTPRAVPPTPPPPPVAPAVPALPPAPASAPAAVPASPPVSVPGVVATQRVHDWAAAWRAKDLERYMSFYAKDFQATTMSNEAWLKQRKQRVTKKGPIRITLGPIETRRLGPATVETAFMQSYRSLDYDDDVLKVLTWRLTDDQWLIIRETNR